MGSSAVAATDGCISGALPGVCEVIKVLEVENLSQGAGNLPGGTDLGQASPQLLCVYWMRGLAWV